MEDTLKEILKELKASNAAQSILHSKLDEMRSEIKGVNSKLSIIIDQQLKRDDSQRADLARISSLATYEYRFRELYELSVASVALHNDPKYIQFVEDEFNKDAAYDRFWEGHHTWEDHAPPSPISLTFSDFSKQMMERGYPVNTSARNKKLRTRMAKAVDGNKIKQTPSLKRFIDRDRTNSIPLDYETSYIIANFFENTP